MTVDFHTHIFPEKIASKALQSLKEGMKREQGYCIEPCFDGTPEDLKRLLEESGIDIAVTMPIATRVKSVDSINDFAKQISCEKIKSFATVHPLSENCTEQLKKIAEAGFKGIKIHPEFQSFYIDSKESINVIKTAEELDLYVTVHAGEDIGMPPPVHCTPERIKNVLSCVSGKNMIAAHLGGYKMWDDVEKYLVGTPIYMDTAFISRFIDKEQCRRIITRHGSEKVLFGSDAPWENPADTLKFILSLGLSQDETENITHRNAERLLGTASGKN